MNNRSDSRPKRPISSSQWKLVVEGFEEILDGASPAEVLKKHEDPAVRTTLERLWARHLLAEASTFLLDQPLSVVNQLNPDSVPIFVPTQLLAGRFGVLRMLGRGGMGEVYLAEDRRLQECVAVKTIRHPLVTEQAVRERFLSEVQNARRVTHPNVCRIYDLFDEGSTPFYSMEYVPGPTLAEALSTGLMDQNRARLIAIQIAEGLLAAHKTGILHCDLKPANIILGGGGKITRTVITDFGLARAFNTVESGSEAMKADVIPLGTVAYMGPELLRGEPPTVQSDIYAYGRVLSELMPRNRLAAHCLQADAEHRPASLEPVLRALKDTRSRRAWMVGALAAAGGVLGIYFTQHAPKSPLGSRQRLRVNGFQSKDSEYGKVLHNLIVLALRQSPLLSVIGERAYRARNGATLSAGVPLPLVDLLNTARQEKAGLVLDGSVERAGQMGRIVLSVFEPQNERRLFQVVQVVNDSKEVVKLAELAARELLAQFGESPSALRSTYTPLETVTSSVPEAIDLYFRAVFFYEQANSAAALALLDQALRFDPEFALAYHYKALALGSQNRLESALISSEKAFSLKEQVSTRERNWIESLYYNFAANWVESANALRRNILLFPDEGVFERQYAFAEASLGRYEEAVLHNRRALELDPFAVNNASELVVNLAEAGKTTEAAEALRQLEELGINNGLMRYPAGAIAMQVGDYRTAVKEYQDLGQESAGRQRWGSLLGISPLVMMGEFGAAIQQLEGDLAYGTADQAASSEETRDYLRRSWLGELYRLKDQPGKAAQQAQFLISLKALPCNVRAIREGTLLAANLDELRLVELGCHSLRTVANRWASTQTQGIAWLAEARLQELTGDSTADANYARAKGAWPDPLSLYTLARWESAMDRPESVMATLDELDRLQGKIFKMFFAGYVVFTRLERARCLVKMSRFAEALRIYNWIAITWQNAQTSGKLMSAIRKEQRETIERTSK